MADIYDRAQQLDEAERDACVAAQRAKTGLVATGFCLDPACHAPLPEGRLFCGGECRDYFEKHQRMKAILGGK